MGHLLWITVFVGLAGLTPGCGGCSMDGYALCVQERGAQAIYSFMGDHDCRNWTSARLRKQLGLVSGNNDSCTRQELWDCPARPYDTLTSNDAMTTVLSQMAADIISKRCGLSVPVTSLCAAHVYSCMTTWLDMQYYTPVNYTDPDSMAEQLDQASRVLRYWWDSNPSINKLDITAACKRMHADRKSELPQLLSCLQTVADACSFSLNDHVHASRSHAQLLALSVQSHVFTCSEGCTAPPMSERMRLIINCREETNDAISSYGNHTTNVDRDKVCRAKLAYVRCLMDNFRDCAALTDSVHFVDFRQDLQTLLGGIHCPDVSFEKVLKQLQDLHRAAREKLLPPSSSALHGPQAFGALMVLVTMVIYYTTL